MQMNRRSTRSIALLTGGVLAASALVQPAPAQADKSKTYKAGAVVLGAASAYLILKGKTLPGALAGIGAYYAYKKGRDAQRDQQSAQYPDQGQYAQYPQDNTTGNYGGPAYGDNGAAYPDNTGYNSGDNPGYNNPGYNPAGYNPGSTEPGYDNSGYNAGYNTGSQDNRSGDQGSYRTQAPSGQYPDYGYRALAPRHRGR